MIHPLAQRFRQIVQDQRLFGAQDRLLVAVSGGVDSMALLHLLASPHAPSHASLHAAHLDHALRPESAGDAEFVARACAVLGVPLHQERIDVRVLAAGRRIGLEEAGRGARRAFLERTAGEQGLGLVLLAHQRDDQAETVLHRLLRGTGPAGLAAMRPRDGRWVRPLLDVSRAELLDYLETQGIRFVADPSNADPAFTRNRIRHELLPQLATFNPRVVESLTRIAALATDEEEVWSALVDGACAETLEVSPRAVRVDLPALARHPVALRRRVLRRALEILRGDLRGIESTHLLALEELADGTVPQGDLDLPGAWAGRRYDLLWLRHAPPDVSAPAGVSIAEPGTYAWLPGVTIQVSASSSAAAGHQEVFVDPGRFPLPLEVRPFRAGDRIRLPGGGRKKVKEVFAEARVVREARDCWPLLVHGDEILWVPGLRCSALLDPPFLSPQVLRVSVQMPENSETFLVGQVYLC